MDRFFIKLRYNYRLHRTKLNILALLAFVVGTSSLIAAPMVLAASDENQAARVITVHDQGQDIGILTDEDTLREVFKQNNIEINPHDHVEPGLDYQLGADTYDVNIYRARPVTIIDGAEHYRIVTSYQTPKQIAEVAGITLYDEDKAQLRGPIDPLAEGSGLILEITRSTPIKVDFFGKKMTMRTMADTVGGFLDEKGISLAENEKTSLPLDTKITKNMKLGLWRNGKQTITKTESIDFPVQRINDADKPVGYSKITQKGKKGKKEVTYTVTMRNGKEYKRKQIHSVTISKPEKQVEVVGTKHTLPAGSHEDWMKAAGISPSDYGYVNAIFQQESGWNPGAANPAGYYGLGQTSMSNISGACGSGWASDPICQIKFFDGYKNRYGSWKAAYEFKFGADGKSGAGWW